MKKGFTLVELLITLVVGMIALGAIIFAMNQFNVIGPRALAKVNQAAQALLIDEKLQSELLKMGPSAQDISVDPNATWSTYIGYDVQVPFAYNNYLPITLRATITTQGTTIVLLYREKSDSTAPIQKLKIASGIKSLMFQYQSGTVKYRLVLYKDSVTSTFVSAVTSMNLK